MQIIRHFSFLKMCLGNKQKVNSLFQILNANMEKKAPNTKGSCNFFYRKVRVDKRIFMSISPFMSYSIFALQESEAFYYFSK